MTAILCLGVASVVLASAQAATPVRAGQATGTPAPSAPQISPDYGSLTAQWDAFGPDGDTVAYRVEFLSGQAAPTPGPVSASCTVQATEPLHCTVEGLTRARSYSAAVTALDTAGASLLTSAPSLAERPWAAPQAPQRPVAAPAGHRALLVTWKPPTDSGGVPVASYLVRREGGKATLCTVPAGTLRCTLKNLSPTTKYRFRILAVNGDGKRSPASPASLTAQPSFLSLPLKTRYAGAKVRTVQQRLTWAGLPTPITGVYSKTTARQVRHLQEKFLMKQTGVVDKTTWKRLMGITGSKAALPEQCTSPAKALCVSKTQRVLRYMVKGKAVRTVDVRFGPEDSSMRTPVGLFEVNWKAREHTSSQYGSPMPFTMNIVGGVAVHYSYYFASDGYWGNSHGCINVRDWDTLEWIFDRTPVGTPVYVYW